MIRKKKAAIGEEKSGGVASKISYHANNNTAVCGGN